MYKFIILIILILVYLFLFSNNEYFLNQQNNIYVINLDKDKLRLKKIKKQAQNQNITIIRHNAINGYKLNKNSSIIKKYISNKFKCPFNKQGSMGCLLSHVTLYRKLIKEKKPYYIILEDDSIIPNNFNNKLNNILIELPKDWDFVYLGINTGIGSKYSTNLVKPNFSKYGNWGSFGYMISYKGLQKLIKYSINITTPIDNFFKLVPLNYFITNPLIIKHDYNAYSNIKNKSRNNENHIQKNKVTII